MPSGLNIIYERRVVADFDTIWVHMATRGGNIYFYSLQLHHTVLYSKDSEGVGVAHDII